MGKCKSTKVLNINNALAFEIPNTFNFEKQNYVANIYFTVRPYRI
jgi:hypothetical protein